MDAREDHETEIMDEEQITEGATEPGDQPWREQLALAQGWQTLVAGIENRWPESGLKADALSRYREDPDALVEAVSDATDQTAEAVEAEFDRIVGDTPGS